MWALAWLLLCSCLPQCWSYYYNNDAAYILDRILTQDYGPGPNDPNYPDIDYAEYEDIRPPVESLPGNIGNPGNRGNGGQLGNHVIANKINPINLDSAQKFPVLTPKQKQFAVNPESQVFGDQNPDFLQYRLEELDEAPAHVDISADNLADNDVAGLEEQLQSILGSYSDQEEAAADKRAMLGAIRAAPLVAEEYQEERSDDFLFTSIVAGATAASVFIVIGAGYCYHKSAMRAKAGEDVEYPAYGVTGPAKDCSPAGDRKLAQSAQMYHYQHQKNQMISRSNGAPGHNDEESDGECEGEEGDYTVYECPGLASTDEMEVKNPLFHDDPTPKNP